jgi:hypothetical protein
MAAAARALESLAKRLPLNADDKVEKQPTVGRLDAVQCVPVGAIAQFLGVLLAHFPGDCRESGI